MAKDKDMEAAKADLAAKRAAKAKEDEALLAKAAEDRKDVPPGIEEIEAAERNGIQYKNVWLKLLYVQQKLKVGKNRGKDHGGTVGYNYRNAQDILEAAKPLLDKVGAIINVNVTPEVIGIGTPVDVRVVGKDKYGNEILARMFGPRFVARAKATFIDCLTGESISAESFAEIDAWRKGQTEPEKLSGSADSYSSKYALAHLFGLDDGKDADSEGDKPAKDEQPW